MRTQKLTGYFRPDTWDWNKTETSLKYRLAGLWCLPNIIFIIHIESFNVYLEFIKVWQGCGTHRVLWDSHKNNHYIVKNVILFSITSLPLIKREMYILLLLFINIFWYGLTSCVDKERWSDLLCKVFRFILSILLIWLWKLMVYS